MTAKCGDKMLHLTRATEGLTLDQRGGENSLGWVGEGDPGTKAFYFEIVFPSAFIHGETEVCLSLVVEGGTQCSLVKTFWPGLPNASMN